MKERCLILSLAFLAGFCALAFQFQSGVLRAEETPIPSATPGATVALLTSTAPPVPSATPATTGAGGISPTPEPFSVRWVGKHTWKEELRHQPHGTYAQRGEDIWVDIINFKAWVDSLRDKKPPEKHEIKDLILYLNHIALDAVSPIYAHETEWEIAPSVKTTPTTVGFSLVRNDKSKPGWRTSSTSRSSTAR